jgi:hypothetical protein
MRPYMPLQRFACASILEAEFVVESAGSSGIRSEPILRSRKWFTMYMRPVGLAPDGRSSVHLGKVSCIPSVVRGKTYSGNVGSVVS